MKKISVLSAFLFALTILSFSAVSCSSAPKRPMAYTDISNRAYDNYEKANAAITRGDYLKASKYLNEAYTQALSIDKNDLLCKIFLSSVSYRIQFPDAFGEDEEGNKKDYLELPSDVEKLIENARTAASLTQEEKLYQSITNVFECRAKLFKGQFQGGRFVNVEIQGILDEEIKALAKQPYYLAFLYRTKGECHNYAKDYVKAAQNFEKAAEIHTKDRYLYEISYDWYLAAQCQSKAGNKDLALKAIKQALKYDRDAENSAGIAQDYMAAAIILMKGSATKEEKKNALFSAEKARSIYEAAGYMQNAENCAQWIEDNK